MPDKARPSGFPRRPTADGSSTLYSPEYDEDFHSRSGAWLEARERYVALCEVARCAEQGPVRILDVGFGLGWNLAWAVVTALAAPGNSRISVVSLEKQPLPWGTLEPLYVDFPQAAGSHGSRVRRAVRQLLAEHHFEDERISLQLVVGDAEQEIRGVSGPFDCVFLDPFSPSRNPELWEAGFLQEIRRRTRVGGILSTYCAATAVKVALLRAGWQVGPGPRVGGKATGTLATHGVVGELPFAGLPPKEQRRLQRRADAADLIED